jgi:hypothetical protein
MSSNIRQSEAPSDTMDNSSRNFNALNQFLAGMQAGKPRDP